MRLHSSRSNIYLTLTDETFNNTPLKWSCNIYISQQQTLLLSLYWPYKSIKSTNMNLMCSQCKHQHQYGAAILYSQYIFSSQLHYTTLRG